MFDLRPYQREALDAIRDAEARGLRRVIVAIATGGGKTVIFSHLIAERRQRALVLAHRDELIGQAVAKIRRQAPELTCGVVKGADDQVAAQVVVASIQTLAQPARLQRLLAAGAHRTGLFKPALGPIGLVVVDEAHHYVGANTFGKVLEALGSHRPDGPLVVGFTATPERADRHTLGGWWEEIVYRKSMLDGIAEGWLVRPRGVEVKLAVDFGRLSVRAGDFANGELDELLREADAPHHVVRAYLEHTPDRKGLVFTPSIAAAHDMAQAFVEAGIPAEALSGRTPVLERRAILARLAAGDTRIVANAQALTSPQRSWSSWPASSRREARSSIPSPAPAQPASARYAPVAASSGLSGTTTTSRWRSSGSRPNARPRRTPGMSGQEQLEAVRGLVAAGLSVIPLPRPDANHDGKVPTFPWKDYQARHPTDAELLAWFGNGNGPRNLAVITGAISGVCVVDADSAQAETWLQAHLPPTPWRVRTARGVHWYYRHPGGRVANRVHAEVPGGTIDLRGDGGYVVGPGSVHASGAIYAPEGDWNAQRDDLPLLPMDALPAPRPRSEPRPAPTAQRDTPARVLERARAYAATCDPAIQGQGGDTQTFLVCCRIARGFDLDEQAAVGVLRAWNARCVPPWTEEQLVAKVRNALRYGDEPLGARRDEPPPAPTSPPLRLGGHEVEAMHPDHPDAEKEPPSPTGTAGNGNAAAGPRPWIEPASDFLARVDAPERWLVNELLPAGVLALVHGEPRARKSWFALELATALCTGTRAFGLERFTVPEAVPVLYSSQEDAASRVRKRAQRFLRGRGIDGPPPGLYFSVHAGIDLEDATWQEVLIQDCRRFGIKAVILDPIRRYSPNVDKGPAEVRAVTSFLRKLSVEAACTVVIVHHDVKPGKEEDTRRRGHRASGGDWFAACEAPIHVEPAGKDASLVVPEDYKFSDDPESFVFRIEGKAEDPTVCVVAETTSAADAKLLTLQDRVLQYLGEHPGSTQNAIVRGCKIGRSTAPEVLSALERAGEIDSVEGPRKSTLWFLPGTYRAST